MAEYKRWYGIFRAVVVEVEDPFHLDRVRVRVPEVLGNTVTDWVWPKDANPNWSWKPVVGERVWIEFENGDVDRPLYSGTWYPLQDNTSSLPSDVIANDYADYLRTRVIQTPGFHKIVFKDPDPEDSDVPTGIAIETVGGSKIELKDDDSAKGVAITTPGGHRIDLDDANSELKIEHSDGTTKIEIDSSGNMTITAGGTIDLLGNSGTQPSFGVVCAGTPNTPCAFTGGPHPAGSATVKANTA